MENAGIRNTFAMALPLRTIVRFTPSEGITQLVPSREARVYDSGVGPREDRSCIIGPDSPDELPFRMLPSGALRQSRRFSDIGWRLCCEHCGCAMDTRSYFAEIDLHILTFDIPDDVLERAQTLWFGSVLP